MIIDNHYDLGWYYRENKSDSQPRYYAAYGSNLNLFQMEQRCPTARVAGSDILTGWRLRFRGRTGRGVATIERAEGGTVPLLIFMVQPEDEISLDRYEGFPRLYRKEEVDVYVDGKRVTAFIYIMNEDRHPYEQPNEHYFRTVFIGYLMNGFDPTFLETAYVNNIEVCE